MARGDQIYVMREFVGLDGVYQHHGIDCGDGTVIHYRKTDVAEISRTSMASFAGGKPVYVKHYAVCYVPDAVVQRAESRLGERKYNLIANNCEHFANWCKTGVNESAQLANFGLDVSKISDFGLRQLITEATDSGDPNRAIKLAQQAMQNIAIAEASLQPQYQQAQTEMNTWHQVALLALNQGKEAVARAALQRKVEAKKAAASVKAQLDQLEVLKEPLQRNQRLLQQVVVQ